MTSMVATIPAGVLAIVLVYLLLYRFTPDDLERALEELLAGNTISQPLTNPIGCNVKWEGKDAHWMPVEACDLV